jgi:hypothetical protein
MGLAFAPLGLSLLAMLAAVDERKESLEDGKTAVYQVRVGLDGADVRHGDYREVYADGTTAVAGRYADGLKGGKWEFFHPNGKRSASGAYRDGERSGTWRTFYADGELESRGRYRDGWRDGEWEFRDAGGEPDAFRSGEYGRGEEVVGDAHGVGPTLDGWWHDDWTWTLGCARLAARYSRGALNGQVAFVHRDGTPDPDVRAWPYLREKGPGEYPMLERLRREPLAEATPLAPVEGRLYTKAQQRYCDAWNAWAALPSGDPAGEAHAATLAEVAGGLAYPRDGAIDARERWRTFFLLTRDRPAVWSIDLALGAAGVDGVEQSILYALPVPPELRQSGQPARPGSRLFAGRYTPREMAVTSAARGAAWLTSVQQADGSWDPAPCDGYRVITTSLAICACEASEDPEARAAAARGVMWLIGRQDPGSGAFTSGDDREPVTQHAWAIEALHAVGLANGTPAQRRARARAARYLVSIWDAKRGWERPGESPTVEAFSALAPCVSDDPELWPAALGKGFRDAALEWCDRHTDPEGIGRPSPPVGPDVPRLDGHRNRDATAQILRLRLLLGSDREDERVNTAMRHLASLAGRGVLDADPDPIQLALQAITARGLGGMPWKAWAGVVAAVAARQEHDGSWVPWGGEQPATSRAFATAILAWLQALCA